MLFASLFLSPSPFPLPGASASKFGKQRKVEVGSPELVEDPLQVFLSEQSTKERKTTEIRRATPSHAEPRCAAVE